MMKKRYIVPIVTKHQMQGYALLAGFSENGNEAPELLDGTEAGAKRADWTWEDENCNDMENQYDI